MSNQITFYVLIPVYNVEKYITNCIESVLKQTYPNFKMVIVDDGSPDRAGEICDEYAQKDKRIKVIHQTNAGLMAARRKAISYVKSEEKNGNAYVIFLDSDDSLRDNALQKIYQTISAENCDVVIYGMDRVIGKTVVSKSARKKEYLGTVTDKRLLYKMCFGDSAYNPLCRKAVFVDLLTNDDYSKYYHISRSEDLIQDIEIYKKCKKVSFIPDKLYHYTVNINSITQTITYENYRYDSTVRMCVWDFLEHENVWSSTDWDEYIKYCKKQFREEIKIIISFDTSYKNRIELLKQIKSGQYYQKIRKKIDISDGTLFLLKTDQLLLLYIYSNIIRLWRRILKGTRNLWKKLR